MKIHDSRSDPPSTQVKTRLICLVEIIFLSSNQAFAVHEQQRQSGFLTYVRGKRLKKENDEEGSAGFLPSRQANEQAPGGFAR